MLQIQENPEEGKRKLEITNRNYRKNPESLWFQASDIYDSIANFMDVLNEKKSFYPEKEFKPTIVTNYLFRNHGGLNALVEVPPKPEIDLDDILPGEFAQFGLHAVLQATKKLMFSSNNDNPDLLYALQRWEEYFPELKDSVEEILWREKQAKVLQRQKREKAQRDLANHGHSYGLKRFEGVDCENPNPSQPSSQDPSSNQSPDGNCYPFTLMGYDALLFNRESK